jgi:hypothetical protein
MKTFGSIALALVVASLFVLPNAAAHPAAVPVAQGATTCYVFENFDVPEVQYWKESNDVTTGGEPTAQDYAANAPGEPDEGTSGLQRADFTDENDVFHPADTALTASQFATECAGLP